MLKVNLGVLVGQEGRALHVWLTKRIGSSCKKLEAAPHELTKRIRRSRARTGTECHEPTASQWRRRHIAG